MVLLLSFAFKLYSCSTRIPPINYICLAEIIPPFELHWQLLPSGHRGSKARLIFDIAHSTEDIRLVYADLPRPLTTIERDNPATKPSVQDLILRCDSLPEWPIYVSQPRGVRCIDVYEAIHDAFNIVLTTTEKMRYKSQVSESEQYSVSERRKLTETVQASGKDLRRIDLLHGRTYFQGLDWVPPDKQYADGSWEMKLGRPTN